MTQNQAKHLYTLKEKYCISSHSKRGDIFE